MTYVPAAPEFERLPWLNDDAKPVPRSKRQLPLILWSGIAALLVAGGSYWIGVTSSAGGGAGDGAASATISLPQPYSAAGEEQVRQPAMPQVEPVAPPPPVSLPATPRRPAETRTRQSTAVTPTIGRSRAAEAREAARAARAVSVASSSPDGTEREAPKTSEQPPQYWPAEQSQGSAGRMVRIGTFGSRLQAKRGWRAIVRVYPGMSSLKAVVVPQPSLRNGRTYYRLQFGTTSQAHSTILCQRMRSIGQSCVLIGSQSGVAG